MNKSKYGVHASHCCVLHGCKYGDEDCPVVSGEIKQEYICEDCGDDRIKSVEEVENIFKNNINSFYDAWWYLYKHSIFQDDMCSRFLDCLDVHVAKVNPITCEIDDDEFKNTKVEIWLEAGKFDGKQGWHDAHLDCGGTTYEEAIIKLANLVHEYYDCYKM